MNIAKKFNTLAAAIMLHIAPMRDKPEQTDVRDERNNLTIDPPQPPKVPGVKI